jgi:hypothetical protein
LSNDFSELSDFIVNLPCCDPTHGKDATPPG